MNGESAVPETLLGSIPLTASGGRVGCDLLAADGTPCPSSVVAVGSVAAVRATAAARGWRTVMRDGDTLDVCPNHPDQQ